MGEGRATGNSVRVDLNSRKREGENKIAPWGSRNGGDDARGDFRRDDGDLADDLAEGRGIRRVC